MTGHSNRPESLRIIGSRTFRIANYPVHSSGMLNGKLLICKLSVRILGPVIFIGEFIQMLYKITGQGTQGQGCGSL